MPKQCNKVITFSAKMGKQWLCRVGEDLLHAEKLSSSAKSSFSFFGIFPTAPSAKHLPSFKISFVRGRSPWAWNPALSHLVKLSPEIILPAPETSLPPQTAPSWEQSDSPPAAHLFGATAAPSLPLPLSGLNSSGLYSVLSTKWLQHPPRPFLRPSASREAGARVCQRALLRSATRDAVEWHLYSLRSPCRASPRTRVLWLGTLGSHLGSSWEFLNLSVPVSVSLGYSNADLNWQDLKIKRMIVTSVKRRSGFPLNG